MLREKKTKKKNLSRNVYKDKMMMIDVGKKEVLLFWLLYVRPLTDSFFPH